MRTRASHLLLVPLFLLGTACAEDPPISAPGDASLAEQADGGGSSYEVIALGGGNGNAWTISDAGVAVGSAREGSGVDPYPALRWVVNSEGITGPEDLGSLPPPFDDAFSHNPQAINKSGVIVGYFNHNNRHGAFVYSDSLRMQLLPRFVGATYHYYAYDVSDLGIVVGSIEYSVRDEDGTLIDRPTRAAVWANGEDEPILLPPLAGHVGSSAGAVNRHGLVTGSSWPEGGSSVGVAWEIDEAGELLEGPYGLEAGFRPVGLNNDGDMAGSYPEFCKAAFIRAGVVTVLNPLAPDECTHVADISDAAADGVVRIVGSTGDRPTIWTVHAEGQVVGPVDLGSEKPNRGAYARGVNVHGWVVGGGRTPHGDIPLLWLPTESGHDDEGDDGTCTHPRGKCK